MSTEIAIDLLERKIVQARNELSVQQHRLSEARIEVSHLEQTIAGCEAAITALKRPPWPKT